jgi:integrase
MITVVLTKAGGSELVEVDQVPADRNPAAVYLASLSPGSSRRTSEYSLKVIGNILAPGSDWRAVPWHKLRYEHTAAIRAELLGRYTSHVTINTHLARLRGVLRAAWRLGWMTADEYARAADLPAVAGEAIPIGRHVSAAELVAMLGTCDGSYHGRKDAAILCVLYGCGLRRAELVGLDLADVDMAGGLIRVRHGKGHKQREIPIDGGTVAALVDWIALRGNDPGPLFLSRMTGGRIGADAIYLLIRRHAAAAGVRQLMPHDMRRSLASDLFDQGIDVATVQKILGHADPKDTVKYDRRGIEARRAAVRLRHVPYVPAEDAASS